MNPKLVDKWALIIQEWETSGLSKAEFCRQKKVSASSFQVWQRKLQPAPSKSLPKKEMPQQFLEIHLPREVHQSTDLKNRVLRITTSYGAILEIPL